jgi:hypothetical protein
MSQPEPVQNRPEVPIDYEAPRVERVLTPGEIEHEILYAGTDRPSGVDQDPM